MKAITSIFKGIDNVLSHFERAFCGIGILIITALILMAVICRSFFGFSFSWLEELCQYLMVWITCIGGVISVANNEHVGVDLLFNFLPGKLHKHYRIVLAFASSIFLAYFTKISWDMVLMIKSTGQTSISMLWLQMYWIYIAVFLGCGLMAIEYIKVGLRLFKDIRKGRLEREEKALDKLETM